MGYKWLIIADDTFSPLTLKGVRYDADITLVKTKKLNQNETHDPVKFNFEDIYIHPLKEASANPWATWNETHRLSIGGERDRIYRRNNLRKFPLRIFTPVRHLWLFSQCDLKLILFSKISSFETCRLCRLCTRIPKLTF